jgi:hypothetical protein
MIKMTSKIFVKSIATERRLKSQNPKIKPLPYISNIQYFNILSLYICTLHSYSVFLCLELHISNVFFSDVIK